MLESRPDPEDPTVPESLDDLRREIDAIDDRLVSALGERAKVAARIAALKAGAATPSLAPERERAILARISELDASPFDAEHIGAIFREIFSASRSLEEPERVAYLGPPFTFSHQAAQLHFGHSAEFVPMGSFRDVFDAVDASDTAYGVVPIENSTSGTIGETLDLLSEHEVSVFSEIELPISHSLLALEGRDEYTIVYSHAQCSFSAASGSHSRCRARGPSIHRAARTPPNARRAIGTRLRSGLPAPERPTGSRSFAGTSRMSPPTGRAST